MPMKALNLAKPGYDTRQLTTVVITEKNLSVELKKKYTLFRIVMIVS